LRFKKARRLLFMVAGVFMRLVWAMGAIGNAPPAVAATSIALGLGNLWRFRHPRRPRRACVPVDGQGAMTFDASTASR